jgi:hypothetical protein
MAASLSRQVALLDGSFRGEFEKQSSWNSNAGEKVTRSSNQTSKTGMEGHATALPSKGEGD